MVKELASRCAVRGHHILGADRVYEPGARRWASPVAERVADELDRQGDEHPLAPLATHGVSALALTLNAVSRAVGTEAERIAVSGSGVEPMEVWLDGTATSP